MTPPSRAPAGPGGIQAVPVRRALLVATAISAALAVLGGLARLGWHVPADFRAAEHGPLLVLGVFGTIIALERAVALGRAWAYLGPAGGVLGALSLVAGLAPLAAAVSLAASAVLVFVNVAAARRQPSAHALLMVLGALALAAGAGAHALRRPVSDVVPCWLVFFVLTIAAERLELSRLAPTPRWATRALVGLGVAVAALGPIALALPAPAHRALGAAFLAIGAWQLRFDLARRTLRNAGLPRYVALAVLAGAAWLVLAGVGLALLALPAAGPHYDALLHAVFVGYVLSMVFAHAPILLPAVARVEVPWNRALYGPLAFLHAGLALRVGGDLLGSATLRSHGGLCNALALVLFAAAVVWARVRGRARAILGA